MADPMDHHSFVRYTYLFVVCVCALTIGIVTIQYSSDQNHIKATAVKSCNSDNSTRKAVLSILMYAIDHPVKPPDSPASIAKRQTFLRLINLYLKPINC